MEEDHQYKFVLRKLADDTASSTITEIPSDPWLDEQNLRCSTPTSHVEEKKPSEDISFLYSKGVDELFEDKDLYSDLVRLEEEEKKAKQKQEMEFEKLKKELEEYRASDAKNKKKIDELTKENTNLLKSISSLYRTAVSEMERKDIVLASANQKIDSLYVRLQEAECPRCHCGYEWNNDKNFEDRSDQSSSYYKKEYNKNAPKVKETDLSFENKRDQSSSYYKKEYKENAPKVKETDFSFENKRDQSSSFHKKEYKENAPKVKETDFSFENKRDQSSYHKKGYKENAPKDRKTDLSFENKRGQSSSYHKKEYKENTPKDKEADSSFVRKKRKF